MIAVFEFGGIDAASLHYLFELIDNRLRQCFLSRQNPGHFECDTAEQFLTRVDERIGFVVSGPHIVFACVVDDCLIEQLDWQVNQQLVWLFQVWHIGVAQRKTCRVLQSTK